MKKQTTGKSATPPGSVVFMLPNLLIATPPGSVAQNENYFGVIVKLLAVLGDVYKLANKLQISF